MLDQSCFLYEGDEAFGRSIRTILETLNRSHVGRVVLTELLGAIRKENRQSPEMEAAADRLRNVFYPAGASAETLKLLSLVGKAKVIFRPYPGEDKNALVQHKAGDVGVEVLFSPARFDNPVAILLHELVHALWGTDRLGTELADTPLIGFDSAGEMYAVAVANLYRLNSTGQSCASITDRSGPPRTCPPERQLCGSPSITSCFAN